MPLESKLKLSIDLSTDIIEFLKTIMDAEKFDVANYLHKKGSILAEELAANKYPPIKFKELKKNGDITTFTKGQFNYCIINNKSDSDKEKYSFANIVSQKLYSEEQTYILFPRTLSFQFSNNEDIYFYKLENLKKETIRKIEVFLKEKKSKYEAERDKILKIEKYKSDKINSEKEREQQKKREEIIEWFLSILEIKYPNMGDEIKNEIKEKIYGNSMYPKFLQTLKTLLDRVQTDEEVIRYFEQEEQDNVSSKTANLEGGKKYSKREVLGKTMIIYKIQGDRKEYVKHKGKLITIKDYKALMKEKAKKELKLKKKKMST